MKIELTVDAANLIIEGLAELPAKKSFNLIIELQRKIAEASKPKEENDNAESNAVPVG